MAADAVVPEGMTRAGVETIMADSAKVDQRVDEVMPASMMMAKPAAGVMSDQILASSSPSNAAAPDPVRAMPVKLKAGSFQDANNFHMGSGNATIYRGPDGSLLLRVVFSVATLHVPS